MIKKLSMIFIILISLCFFSANNNKYYFTYSNKLPFIIYENFTNKIFPYQDYQFIKNFTIYSDKSYCEINSNKNSFRLYPKSSFFLNINNNSAKDLKGKIFISLGEDFTFIFFNNKADFKYGEYLIDCDEDKITIHSNSGEIHYREENFTFTKAGNTTLTIDANKYSINSKKKSIDTNFFYKKELENNFNSLKKYLDFFINQFIYLLDKNNSYITNFSNTDESIEQLNNEIMKYSKNLNSQSIEKNIDNYIELKIQIENKIYNYSNKLSEYLNFYTISKNLYYDYQQLIKKINFLNKIKETCPDWNSDYSTQYNLLSKRINDFQDTVELFDYNIENSKTRILSNSSKTIKYIQSLEKISKILTKSYTDFINSNENISSNKELLTTFSELYISIYKNNYQISNEINQIFQNQKNIDYFIDEISDVFNPELLSDQIIYQISILKSYQSKKENFKAKIEKTSEYYSMYYYLLYNNNLQIKEIDKYKKDLDQKYENLKFNYIELLKRYSTSNRTINNLRSIIKKNMDTYNKPIFQKELNTHSQKYINYFEIYRIKILSLLDSLNTSNLSIINQYLKHVEFIKSLLVYKKDLYLTKYEDIKFLQKSNYDKYTNTFNRINQNIHASNEEKRKKEKYNELKQKIAIAIIGLSEYKKSISNTTLFLSNFNFGERLQTIQSSINIIQNDTSNSSDNSLLTIQKDLNIFNIQLKQLKINSSKLDNILDELTSNYSLLYLELQKESYNYNYLDQLYNDCIYTYAKFLKEKNYFINNFYKLQKIISKIKLQTKNLDSSNYNTLQLINLLNRNINYLENEFKQLKEIFLLENIFNIGEKK